MTHTQPGLIMGTANYMSPEQARAAASDYRSDQFSFGVVLYETVTGKQPFSRETTVQTAPALLADDPPPIPAGVKIPAPLRWTIDRCMAKDPQQRFHGAGDKLCYKYYYMDTTIRNLDERIYRALRARAVLQGRNVGELLNEAIGGYLARFAVSQGRSTLRDLKPEPFSEGNDFLSQEIDAIVYRERRQ